MPSQFYEEGKLSDAQVDELVAQVRASRRLKHAYL
jgi:hypothetical protein